MTDADQPPAAGEASGDDGGDRPLDPERILRIASLARAVLEEVRHMDPDEHTVAELAALHKRVMSQVEDALPAELAEELHEIDLDLPFTKEATTEGVRVAYAGLIGWLGGLFQGVQAAIQLQHFKTLELQQGGGNAGAAAGREGDSPRGGQYL